MNTFTFPGDAATEEAQPWVLAVDWQAAIEKFRHLNTYKSEAIAGRGVVAANHPFAASAGQLILAQGGSASTRSLP